MRLGGAKFAVEDRSQRSRLSRAIAVGSFVTVLGPLFGSLVFLLGGLVRSIGMLFTANFSTADLSVAAHAVFTLVYLVAIFSYVIGGLPALLAGIALGYHTYHNAHISYLRAIVTSIAATLLGTVVLEFILRTRDETSLGLLFVMIPAAVLSAVLCRSFLGRLGLVTSTNDRSNDTALDA